jgi:antitoxin VapB
MMGEITKAKLFMHGRSQAVRLPKEFRFQGDAVKITRIGDNVILSPIKRDVRALFEALDKYRGIPFMEDGRLQPKMPEDEQLFD